MYCNDDDQCPGLVQLPDEKPVPSAGGSVTDKLLKSLGHILGSFAINHYKDRPVCLVQARLEVTELCRACLKDTSVSKRVGEFLFVLGKSDYIVHVMRTQYSDIDIREPCIASRACTSFESDLYHDDLRDAVHNKGISMY
uniref:AlNc14C92G5724 protein n=1 Tax=Albugo laibachii Nc14 TaxID=890382 RepID=F0WGJ0_9STRA|nr:AlNc14C92G5724 [Albugo laibachii Nc14]|eukprot:CCA20354.1 AlNc14C92G5724 [Albugo laibachii Nc14]